MVRDKHDDGRGGNLRERFSLLSIAQKIAVGTLTAVLSAAIIAGLGLQAFSASPGGSTTTGTSSSSGTASILPGGGEAATTPSTSGNTVAATSHEAGDNPDPPARIANNYGGGGDNTTLNATGHLVLTDITETSSGAIAGQAIWSDGLRGSGPFAGTIKGNSISFTSTIGSPRECADRCTSITYTGTVSTNGVLAGTYVAYQTDGKPERGAWELAPSTGE
ncbi:MAG TPA: hypothetical protein VL979_03995 [Solirubrobacteraceae bacterium]|nr:hypothetical protein [Solirubrobacteraceae bacterium]